MTVKTYKNTKIQWFTSVDDGKQLELLASDEKGNDIEGAPYPLLSIVADDGDETLMIQIVTKEGVIRFPVENIDEAVGLARAEVHSETWYEKNVYNEDPDDRNSSQN